jgi:hypothetical protein
MVFRTSSAAISLVPFFVFSSALCAQRTNAPTLQEILTRLEGNLGHYDANVPSLFCDEHVVSSQMQRNLPDQNTITDSVFRLMRRSGPDHTTALVESRETRGVDGKPANSQHMEGPALLSGIFEGGLAVVSLNQMACMSYTLQPIDRKHPAEPFVVRFATVPTSGNSEHCFLSEKSKGRVIIDPGSVQVTHLEITTPRHTIVDGSALRARVVGKRELAVDYAPVLLGSEAFWMPSAITMRVTTGAGTFHVAVWSFQATYQNYHKMEVTSRILPGETLAR